jgi:hypothetical protein
MMDEGYDIQNYNMCFVDPIDLVLELILTPMSSGKMAPVEAGYIRYKTEKLLRVDCPTIY